MKRVQLSRRKGYKLPPDTVVVSRPSRFGNPFIVGKHGNRRECVGMFRQVCAGYLNIGVDDECIAAQKTFYANLMHSGKDQLRGKNLACYCPESAACHADVLIEIFA